MLSIDINTEVIAASGQVTGNTMGFGDNAQNGEVGNAPRGWGKWYEEE